MGQPKYGGRDCELSTTGMDASGRTIDAWNVTRNVLAEVGPALAQRGVAVWSRRICRPWRPTSTAPTRSRPRASIVAKPYSSDTSADRYSSSMGEMVGRRVSSVAVRRAASANAAPNGMGRPKAPQQARSRSPRWSVTKAPITV